MQPQRTKRVGWFEVVMLVGAVLVFGMLVWVLNHSNDTALLTAAPATEETTVGDGATMVVSAPAAFAYPPPYPLPSAAFSPLPAPSTGPVRPEDGFVMGGCINSPNPSEVALWTETADVVALGTVTKVETPRWTTIDGVRPANPHTDDEIIYTPVIVAVERYFKGEQRTQQIGVLARDGRIGQDRMDYCGDTRYLFGQDERVILFLSSSQVWNETYDGLPLWEVGEHFSITKDNQVVTGPRLGGSLDMPLPQVLVDIDAAVQP